MSHPLDSLRSVEDVDRLAARLYGTEPSLRAGVVHVAAGWTSGAGEIRILRITPSTPKSRLDGFVLAFARARCEAILTTGKILREERGLVHDLAFDRETKGDRGARLLHAWRAHRGLGGPPLLAVLTSGRSLDLSHPAFAGWARPLVFTGAEGARDLRGAVTASGGRVEVVEDSRPSLLRLIAYLRSERGCRTVSIEAGPSTARALYDPPLAVDELLLSLYREELPERRLLGGSLPSLQRLAELFGGSSDEVRVREASGEWGFLRFAVSGDGAVRTRTRS